MEKLCYETLKKSEIRIMSRKQLRNGCCNSARAIFCGHLLIIFWM